MGCMDVLWLEYILLGLALSADACSVSLVYGSRLQPFRWRQAMIPALAFGIAQGLMPVVGWLGGALLASFIEAVDHWIAFGILVVLGGKFIWDSRGDVDIKPETFMSPLAIFVAAFATSIDACAVGFSLNLSGSPIVCPAVVIAVTTFLCSLVCHRIGAALGARFGSRLLLVGGLILIGLGVKILGEHMNWFS